LRFIASHSSFVQDLAAEHGSGHLALFVLSAAQPQELSPLGCLEDELAAGAQAISFWPLSMVA
jgi:hypothetical protein